MIRIHTDPDPKHCIIYLTSIKNVPGKALRDSSREQSAVYRSGIHRWGLLLADLGVADHPLHLVARGKAAIGVAALAGVSRSNPRRSILWM